MDGSKGKNNNKQQQSNNNERIAAVIKNKCKELGPMKGIIEFMLRGNIKDTFLKTGKRYFIDIYGNRECKNAFLKTIIYMYTHGCKNVTTGHPICKALQ